MDLICISQILSTSSTREKTSSRFFPHANIADRTYQENTLIPQIDFIVELHIRNFRILN